MLSRGETKDIDPPDATKNASIVSMLKQLMGVDVSAVGLINSQVTLINNPDDLVNINGQLEDNLFAQYKNLSDDRVVRVGDNRSQCDASTQTDTQLNIQTHTQTDVLSLDETALIFNRLKTIHGDLSDNLLAENLYRHFRDMFELFSLLKKRGYTAVDYASYKLCLQIAEFSVRVALDFPWSSGKSWLYSHALKTLKHYPKFNLLLDERHMIETILKTLSIYIDFISPTSWNELKTFSLMPETVVSKVSHDRLFADTQTDTEHVPLSQEQFFTALGNRRIGVDNKSGGCEFLAKTKRRFETIQKNIMKPFSSSTQQEFQTLTNDMYIESRQLSNENVLTSPTRQQHLEQHLRVQSSYVAYLEKYTQQKQCSSAKRQMLTIYNDCLQQNSYVNSPEATVENSQELLSLRQKLTLDRETIKTYRWNFNQIEALQLVIESSETSRQEKGKAATSQKKLLSASSDLWRNVIANHLNTILPYDLCAQELSVALLSEQHKDLYYALLYSFFALDAIKDIYASAGIYIQNVCNLYLPEAADWYSRSIPLIDGSVANQESIHSHSCAALLKEPSKRKALYEAIELYFRISKYYTENSIIGKKVQDIDIEFFNANKMKIEWRVDVYKRLLCYEDVGIEERIRECEMFLSAIEYATPLIMMLAVEWKKISIDEKRKLSAEIASIKNEDEFLPVVDQSEVVLHTSVNTKKPPEPDNARDFSILDEPNPNLPVLGWTKCKHDFDVCCEAARYEQAITVMNQWIDRIRDCAHTSLVMRHKGLFDGLLYKSIAFKRLHNYEEAEQCLNEAVSYAVADPRWACVREVQELALECERVDIKKMREIGASKNNAYAESMALHKAAEAFTRIAQNEAREIVCFKAIWEEWMLNFNYLKEVPYLEKLYIQLFDAQDLRGIDEYNRPYAYQYYEKVADLLLSNKFLIQNKNICSEFQLSQARFTRLEHCQMIYFILSREDHYQYFPERLAQLYLQLAKCLKENFMLMKRYLDYEQSLNYFSEALKAASRSSNTTLIQRIENDLGSFYSEMNFMIDQSIPSLSKTAGRDDLDDPNFLKEETILAIYKELIAVQIFLTTIYNVIVILDVTKMAIANRLEVVIRDLYQALLRIINKKHEQLDLIFSQKSRDRRDENYESYGVKRLQLNEFYASVLEGIAAARDFFSDHECVLVNLALSHLPEQVEKQKKKRDLLVRVFSLKKKNCPRVSEFSVEGLEVIVPLTIDKEWLRSVEPSIKSIRLKEVIVHLLANRPCDAMNRLVNLCHNKGRTVKEAKESIQEGVLEGEAAFTSILIIQIILWLYRSILNPTFRSAFRAVNAIILIEQIYKFLYFTCINFLNQAAEFVDYSTVKIPKNMIPDMEKVLEEYRSASTPVRSDYASTKVVSNQEDTNDDTSSTLGISMG